MTSTNGPLRVGIGGPVGSGKTALMEALCKTFRDALRHLRHHQRHLHQGGRAPSHGRRRAARRAHHGRRDRRLPAHGHPRGRLDQPRGGRRHAAALPWPRPHPHRVGRRQSRRHLLARSLPTSPSTSSTWRAARRSRARAGRASRAPTFSSSTRSTLPRWSAPTSPSWKRHPADARHAPLCLHQPPGGRRCRRGGTLHPGGRGPSRHGLSRIEPIRITRTLEDGHLQAGMAKLEASDVAKLLVEFGQRIELGGENPYRARAYYKAAESLLRPDRPAARCYRQGTAPRHSRRRRGDRRANPHAAPDRHASDPGDAARAGAVERSGDAQDSRAFAPRPFCASTSSLGSRRCRSWRRRARPDLLRDRKGFGPALQTRSCKGSR